MVSRASWEDLEPEWAAPSGDPQQFGPDDDDTDYKNISPELAGQFLIDMLVTLKIKGILTAKLACHLAFWASKAGATGEASRLGASPGKASGAYSRHFDNWAGVSVHDQELYNVPLVRRFRFDASRRLDALPMRLPFFGARRRDHTVRLAGQIGDGCAEQEPSSDLFCTPQGARIS